MEARPVRILHCFSGRAHRADGLAAALKGKGFECKEVDTLIHDKRHDLLDDTVFDDLAKGLVSPPSLSNSAVKLTMPTCLLNDLPTLRPSFYDPKWSSHCPLWLHPVMEAIKHDLDPEVARGKTANNDWMSAEAAAYPARMNEILADAIQHHCEHLPNASVRFTL